MYKRGRPSRPRSGLYGEAVFGFTPALITPLNSSLVGTGLIRADNPSVSPGVDPVIWDMSSDLVVDNNDVLAARLVGRSTPIQNINVQAEVTWFLDNIGSGTECCDLDSGRHEYTTTLNGFHYEIPKVIHGISGFPSVTVLDPSGAEVSIAVAHTGASVVITSNCPLDSHTAILR